MTITTQTSTTTQVCPVYIKATAQGNDLTDVIIDGEGLEANPPHRLVTTFRMLMDPDTASEGTTRITHELEGAPKLATIVSGSLEELGAGGGHAWVLSDLKTLLETGRAFAG